MGVRSLQLKPHLREQRITRLDYDYRLVVNQRIRFCKGQVSAKEPTDPNLETHMSQPWISVNHLQTFMTCP